MKTLYEILNDIRADVLYRFPDADLLTYDEFWEFAQYCANKAKERAS